MRVPHAQVEALPRDSGEEWCRVMGAAPVQRALQAVVIFTATILSVQRCGADAYLFVQAVLGSNQRLLTALLTI